MIPCGGLEVLIKDYWIMVQQGVWKSCNQPFASELTLTAIASGYEADGTPLFVARAQLSDNRGQQLGKTRFGFPGAYISYGGIEIQGVVPFDILQDLNYQWLTPAFDVTAGFAVVQGGQEANGNPLYPARAMFNGSLCPGKTGGNVAPGTADIPFGGAEHSVNNFATLYAEQAVWVQASNGRVPDGAVVSGYEPNGEPLYVARAAWAGGVHPGKVRLGLDGAHISFDGGEYMVPNYEVLVTSAFTGVPPTGY